MDSALYILRHSISGSKVPLRYVKDVILSLNPGKTAALPLLFCLLLLFLFDLANERGDTIRKISAQSVYIRWPVYISFLLLLLVMIPKEGTAPFIYFQF